MEKKSIKRNKNTFYLDLNFIKNKGLCLNINDLCYLTVERFTGTLIRIDKDKNNLVKNNNNLILYNISFFEILKAIELEKYWLKIDNKCGDGVFVLNLEGDCVFSSI